MSLCVEELAAAKGFVTDELVRFGVCDVDEHVEIPYLLADGTQHTRTRIRTDAIAKRGSRWSAGDAPLVPYGLNSPIPIDSFVFIAEGESDCWAMWVEGLPAIGIPGATNARCLNASHVGSAQKAYVVREPGEAGARFPHLVANALYDSGYTGTVYSMSMPRNLKDPQEAFAADRAHFKETMRLAVKNAAAIARPISVPSNDREEPKAVTSAAFLQGNDDVEHCVEGLVPKSGSMIIGGRKKAGKGILLLNLARSVARGEPFLGRRARQGSVLYLSLDESESITRERASLLGIAESDPIFWVCTRSRPRDWERWLRGLVVEHRPDIIIADTLVKLAAIQKIEDYGAWNEAYRPLYRIADEFDCAFVVSAHIRKSGDVTADAIAGSTAAGGGVDTIMVLERKPDNVRVVSTEQRQGEDMDHQVLKMDPDTLELSIGPELWLQNQRAVEQLALDAMRDEWLGRDAIMKRVRKKGIVVKRAISSLYDGGLIERKGAGRKDDAYVYRAITKSGPSNSNSGPRINKKPVKSGVILGPNKAVSYIDQVDQPDQAGPTIVGQPSSLLSWSANSGPRMDQLGPSGTENYVDESVGGNPPHPRLLTTSSDFVARRAADVPCAFFIGSAGSVACQRCGARLLEHA